MSTKQQIKEKIKVYKPISHTVSVFDLNIHETSNTIYEFKDKQGNRVRVWVFSDRIKIEIPLSTSLLFSVNFPDKVCLANKNFAAILGIGTLFTDNSENDQIVRCIDILSNDLKSLSLDKSREGLIVYRNALQVILKNDRTIIEELSICMEIKSKIEIEFPDIIRNIDYSDLPKELKLLILKFKSWILFDDFERDIKIKESTKKERTDLINAIYPKLDSIIIFLNSFENQSLSEGAINLQALVEIVMELKSAHDA